MQSKKNPPRTAEGRISMTQTLRRVDRLLLRSRRILSRGGPSPGPLVGRPGPVPVVAPMRTRRSHRFRRLGAGGGGGRLSVWARAAIGERTIAAPRPIAASLDYARRVGGCSLNI